jgi:hypothetical protein
LAEFPDAATFAAPDSAAVPAALLIDVLVLPVALLPPRSIPKNIQSGDGHKNSLSEALLTIDKERVWSAG